MPRSDLNYNDVSERNKETMPIEIHWVADVVEFVATHYVPDLQLNDPSVSHGHIMQRYRPTWISASTPRNFSYVTTNL
jgi:hypothetical protein